VITDHKLVSERLVAHSHSSRECFWREMRIVINV